jgi:hypothetical protein
MLSSSLFQDLLLHDFVTTLKQALAEAVYNRAAELPIFISSRLLLSNGKTRLALAMPESHHINLNEQDSQQYKGDLHIVLRLHDNVLRHKYLVTTFITRLSFKSEEIT